MRGIWALVAVVVVLCTVAAGQGRGARIAGRIIAPDGAPAPDAQVFVARRGQPRMRIAQTRSGWDGRYEITGVPPGEYLVGASNPASHQPQVVTLYPGVLDSDDATPVTVFEGVPAEGIDVWLLPAAKRFSVAGQVVNAQGRGISAEIEYGVPGGPQADVWYVRFPDGYFTIEGVPSGTLVLLGRAESPDGTIMGLASTEVTLGAVEDVRLVLEKPGRIEGRITPERGTLPPDVRPRLALVQTLFSSSALYPDETVAADPDGYFRVDNVLGRFRIEVRELPDGWTVRRILRDGRPLPDRRLRVSPGDLITGLEIKLEVQSGK